MTRRVATLTDPDDAAPMDWRTKGIAQAHVGLTADRLGQAGVHVFDDTLHFPVATLEEDVVAANGRWMRTFLRQTGVALAPHGKTTMAPGLLARQLADGAWGVTAATIGHVRAFHAFGVERIVLANQLIGDGAIRWVVETQNAEPRFELLVFVDSTEGAAILARSAARWAARRPIKVLIEVGHAEGRCGVRDVETGLAVAQSIADAAPQLELCGVATYEGVFQTRPDGAERAARMVRDAIHLADQLERADRFGATFILSGGGSAFFDLVADQAIEHGFRRRPAIILRSGCYLIHDDGLYRDLHAAFRARRGLRSRPSGTLRPALRVWSHVVSHPEPNLWICGLGRRDIGWDAGAPVLTAWARPGDQAPRPAPGDMTVVAVNDQHLYLKGPEAAPLAIGDIAGFGVSHPCTTIDKWRALFMVDRAWRVTRALRTYF